MLDNFFAQHPGVASAIILALAWLLGQGLKLAVPLIWKKADNTGLVTKQELAAFQAQITAKLAAIHKILDDGDGSFAGLREAQSDMATTIRDLCRALDPLLQGGVDCDRLLRWITSAAKGGARGR